jgi:hypothetical protein
MINNRVSHTYGFANVIEETIVVLKWMFMVTYNFGHKKLWIKNKKSNYGCKNGAFVILSTYNSF